MPAQPGQILDQYRLTEKIGEGGMGQVWRADDTGLDREVAVKILPEGFAENTDRLARFEREAKAVAALAHPNILAVHGFGRGSSRASAVVAFPAGRRSGTEEGIPQPEYTQLTFRQGRISAARFAIGPVSLTPDGRGYVYTYRQLLSTLCIVDGL